MSRKTWARILIGAAMLATVVEMGATLTGPLSASVKAPKARYAEIALRPSDDTEMSGSIERMFVRPMLKLDAGAKVDFAWARYDVDGDGYDELFIAVRGADKCGGAGCPLVVMRKKVDGAWEPILAAMAEKVGAEAEPDGRSKIVVTSGGAMVLYQWNDKRRRLEVRK